MVSVVLCDRKFAFLRLCWTIILTWRNIIRNWTDNVFSVFSSFSTFSLSSSSCIGLPGVPANYLVELSPKYSVLCWSDRLGSQFPCSFRLQLAHTVSSSSSVKPHGLIAWHLCKHCLQRCAWAPSRPQTMQTSLLLALEHGSFALHITVPCTGCTLSLDKNDVIVRCPVIFGRFDMLNIVSS